MIKRTVQAVGGLATVALVTVGAAMATGAPAPPTATSAGSGGGCHDNNAPYSNWGSDWRGHDGNGAYWNGWGDGNGYFDGHAYDRGCGGNSGYGVGADGHASAAGHVDRVLVAVTRLNGSHCQHVYGSGRLSHPGDCGITHWMRAKGTGSWRFDIPKDLPRGHYRLHRRAIDAAGNRERRHALHLRIR